MSFVVLPRIARTASFGLPILYAALFAISVVYAALFAISVVILGTIVYVAVQNALDHQMAKRIEAEIALLQNELRTEGEEELVREVQERTSYFHALDYLVVDARGNRLAGNLPAEANASGWGDIRVPKAAEVRMQRIFASTPSHWTTVYAFRLGMILDRATISDPHSSKH